MLISSESPVRCKQGVIRIRIRVIEIEIDEHKTLLFRLAVHVLWRAALDFAKLSININQCAFSLEQAEYGSTMLC